jgi:hypothetical protein
LNLLAYYTIHRDQFEREKETEDARDCDNTVAGSGSAGVPPINLQWLNLPIETDIDAELVMTTVSSVDLATIQDKMGKYQYHISALEVFGKTVRAIADGREASSAASNLI